MLATAKERLAAMTRECTSYEELKEAFLTSTEGNQAQGFWLVPWKCDADNEEKIKQVEILKRQLCSTDRILCRKDLGVLNSENFQQETKATIRCYPFEHNQSPPKDKKCFYSGEPATHMALFARAF